MERTSGFEPFCERTVSRYLKLLTVPSFCPFTLNSLWMPFSAGQDTMVYKIMLSKRFCSQVNLKLAFVVSDLQVPCIQQN